MKFQNILILCLICLAQVMLPVVQDLGRKKQQSIVDLTDYFSSGGIFNQVFDRFINKTDKTFFVFKLIRKNRVYELQRIDGVESVMPGQEVFFMGTFGQVPDSEDFIVGYFITTVNFFNLSRVTGNLIFVHDHLFSSIVNMNNVAISAKYSDNKFIVQNVIGEQDNYSDKDVFEEKGSKYFNNLGLTVSNDKNGYIYNKNFDSALDEHFVSLR